MADINEIAATYRLHLARLTKHNTRTDYTKRLAMLERWCSMHGITRVEEIDFHQFLDYVFLDRGVSPRTRNNYRTWCRSFCSWLRIDMGNIPPMKEPGKIRQPLSAAILRRIKEHLVLHDKHFLLAVMLEYYTFIRPGELSELKVGDIDVKRHAIHVRAEISKNVHTTDMAHARAGDTTTRASYRPNYLQKYYDTDLNKEVTCIDTENKTWIDNAGNVVSNS